MMGGTGIVFSPRFYDHDTGSYHPESRMRLKFIMDGLQFSGLPDGRACMIVKPEAASTEQLMMIHERAYIEKVRDTCMVGGLLDAEDTVVSKGSFEAAILAAGGVLTAAEKVMVGDLRNAFAIVRPPGHHAGSRYAMGFCIFNNVSFAASALLSKYNLRRIVILDIDAHHGNGTQEIFYGTDKVLFISIHQDPSLFPGVGFVDEAGEGDGLGYNVNIPLPFYSGDRIYLRVLNEIVIPILEEYKPEFIFISAGFDGYYMDPIGDLSLSAHIYPAIFKSILDIAHRLCGGRVVSVLEGGYRLSFLRRIIPVIVKLMAGLNYDILEGHPPVEFTYQGRIEKIVGDIRRFHSLFWSL